jgi:hypothetical protein
MPRVVAAGCVVFWIGSLFFWFVSFSLSVDRFFAEAVGLAFRVWFFFGDNGLRSFLPKQIVSVGN